MISTYEKAATSGMGTTTRAVRSPAYLEARASMCSSHIASGSRAATTTRCGSSIRFSEATVVIGDHRFGCNENRPHSALNQQTPAAFAADWNTINQLTPVLQLD